MAKQSMNLSWLWEWAAPKKPVRLQINEAGLDIIRESEALVLIPYLCPGGVPTIGIGTTIDANGNPVTLSHRSITEEDAYALFSRDIGIFELNVKVLVKVPVNCNQFSALISLAYNIGCGNFRASTLLRKLNRGDYAGCAAQFKWWRRANGIILAGLVKRRKLEEELFCKK